MAKVLNDAQIAQYRRDGYLFSFPALSAGGGGGSNTPAFPLGKRGRPPRQQSGFSSRSGAARAPPPPPPARPATPPPQPPGFPGGPGCEAAAAGPVSPFPPGGGWGPGWSEEGTRRGIRKTPGTNPTRAGKATMCRDVADPEP